MSKFNVLKEKGTNSSNCDLATEDIIEKLVDWDSKYGITVSNVEHDRVDVSFDSIPTNLESFASQVYSFCPDIVDQGYGCLNEMIEMMEESEQPIPDHIQKQIDGIDLSQEGFGLQVLQNVIVQDKKLSLWWD